MAAETRDVTAKEHSPNNEYEVERILGCKTIHTRGSWHYVDPDELKPKDTFWKDIEAGRVDVLSSDKLTRIRQRHERSDSRHTSECESLSSIEPLSSASTNSKDDAGIPRPRRRGRPATKRRSALADDPPSDSKRSNDTVRKPSEGSNSDRLSPSPSQPTTRCEIVTSSVEQSQHGEHSVFKKSKAMAKAAQKDRHSSSSNSFVIIRETPFSPAAPKDSDTTTPPRISLLVPTDRLVVPHPPLTPPTPAVSAAHARRSESRLTPPSPTPNLLISDTLEASNDTATCSSAPPTPNMLLSPAADTTDGPNNPKSQRLEPPSECNFPVPINMRAAAATALTKSRMLLGLYARSDRGRRHRMTAPLSVPETPVIAPTTSKRGSRKPRGAARQLHQTPKDRDHIKETAPPASPMNDMLSDSEDDTAPTQQSAACTTQSSVNEPVDLERPAGKELEDSRTSLGLALLRLGRRPQASDVLNDAPATIPASSSTDSPLATNEYDERAQRVKAARQRMMTTALSREWNLAPLADGLELATFLDLPTVSGIPQYVRAPVERALAQPDPVSTLNALLRTAVQRKEHLLALHVLRVGATLRKHEEHQTRRRGEPHALDCEQRDERLGHTLLMQAVRAGANELVDVLLRFGADANASTRDASALMLASEVGNVAGCAALLANGASLDARSLRDGETALHRAVRRGQRRVVEYLLARGADWTVQRSVDCRTAVQIADDLHLSDVAQHLRKHAGRVSAELREAMLFLLAADCEAPRFALRDEPISGVHVVDLIDPQLPTAWTSPRYRFAFDFQLPEDFLSTLTFGYVICLGMLTSARAGGELRICVGSPRYAPVRNVRVNLVRQPALLPSKFMFGCSPLLNGCNELVVECDSYPPERHPFALCSSAKLLVAVFRVDI